MANVCERCSGTHFETIDGYFYCLECGTQSQTQQIQMETDIVMVGDRTIGGDVVHLKKIVKTTDTRLTSWEEYNYILLGLVEELINLGASYKIKKMALKLWARYLQTTEAAFFSLHDECLPRLPANYQKKDAEILYNKHHRRRKRRRSSCSSAESGETRSTNGKANSVIKSFKISKIMKKAKEDLARAQYEEYKKSQDDTSSVATALATSSQQSGDEKDPGLKIDFTRNARKLLKRKMPKNHIVKHESDYEDALDCHQDHIARKPSDKLEGLSNTILISIIHLALNLTGDDLQAADLIRFLREGHLSYANIQRFLPENVKQKCSSTFEHLNMTGILNHQSVRVTTAKLCKDMSVHELVKPNLVSLTHRYVDELGLPREFKGLLERLIAHHPPEMNYDQGTGHLHAVPNYEGRAMSYIIFSMKLLFGLDDDRESKISDSAREINNLFPDYYDRLFVIEDWLKMLKMRRMVLQKYHMPTAVKRTGDDELMDTARGMNHHRYLEHLKEMYDSRIPEDRPKRSDKDGMGVANNVFELLQGVNKRNGHQSEGDLELSDRTRSFNFAPSTTPFKDYSQVLLEHNSQDSPLFDTRVEKFLRQDFSLDSVKAFYQDSIATERLRYDLAKHCSLKLRVEELSLNSRWLEVVEKVVQPKNGASQAKFKLKFLTEKTKIPKPSQIKEKEILPPIATPDKRPAADDTEESVLYTSNMDYWTYFTNYKAWQIFYPDEYWRMLRVLPNNFKMLVLECARTVEQHPRNLFLELHMLEKVLIYDVHKKDKDSRKFKDMGPQFKNLW